MSKLNFWLYEYDRPDRACGKDTSMVVRFPPWINIPVMNSCVYSVSGYNHVFKSYIVVSSVVQYP